MRPRCLLLSINTTSRHLEVTTVVAHHVQHFPLLHVHMLHAAVALTPQIYAASATLPILGLAVGILLSSLIVS